MSIGENIKKRRRALKLSQQQLADLLGYKSKSSIAKIEKDLTDLPQSKLIAFANVLNTSTDYLLTGRASSAKNDILIVSSKADPNGDPTPVETIPTSFSVEPKVYAVILAGGTAAANQQNTPNQFVNVKGKPVILYALETYQKHPAIDEIYVVCLSGWENIVTAYCRNYGITKLNGIIPAGKTGALSTKSAVEWISSKTHQQDIVIFQESTRPMVTTEMISNIIRCTQEHGSAVTFEAMDEYLQFIKKSDSEIECVDRSNLLSLQSPEAYRFGKLIRAYREAEIIGHPFNETCCVMVLFNIGEKFVFCEGNRYNIKIVRQEDLKFFEALLDKDK